SPIAKKSPMIVLNAASKVVKKNILLFLQVDERILMRKLLLLFACCLTGYSWAQLSANQSESTPEYLTSLADEDLVDGLKDADASEKPNACENSFSVNRP